MAEAPLLVGIYACQRHFDHKITFVEYGHRWSPSSPYWPAYGSYSTHGFGEQLIPVREEDGDCHEAQVDGVVTTQDAQAEARASQSVYVNKQRLRK